MKLNRISLFALGCAWCLGAAAQWQWIDKDGRKVFSDRAPPQEIPEKSILRRPHQQLQAQRAKQPAAPDADAPTAKPSDTVLANAAKPAKGNKGVDKELEERKAKLDAEKAAKEKIEADKTAAAKADNCTRAKQAKALLESGQLMKHTNTKGEQVYMDDAAREAERKRAQTMITSDCAS